jgi:hypothetical protein
MHERFLLSRKEYLAAREFWIRLCNEALAVDPSAGKWVPWVGSHKPGAEVLIEESIYSLYSARQNKSLRIAQYAPGYTQWLQYARMAKFGQGALDHPIDYLLIGCVLSEDTARTAKALITQWVLPTTNFLQMEALIAQMIPGC